MPDPLLLFSWTIAVGTAVASLVVLPRMRRIGRLRASEAPLAPNRPRVAVVVAAKDEVKTLGPALSTLLEQADERLRIVVVNDRSTDGTGALLDSLASNKRFLTVVHVEALPNGWLGKNHALAQGVAAATSESSPPEFLLFTDADVSFVPGGLRGAVDHAVGHGLDHLAGAPHVELASWPLAGQVATFGVLFGLFTRPWSVANPRSSAYVGIGALNLVRRTAYEAAGGHAAIAMRIDDDLRLGRAIKLAGGRSDFAIAGDIASLTWYSSLPAMLRGLHKNAFAAIDFRMALCIGATLFIGAAFLAPFVLALAPTGWIDVAPIERMLLGFAAALHILGAYESARSAGLPGSSALFFPVGLVLFLFVLWRSALGAIITGRVVWRDTAYTLRELKAAVDRH